MQTWLSQNGMLIGLALLDGVSAAAAIFMVAVGLNLIFGVLRILNMAHGSFYAIGGYAAASIGLFVVSLGSPAWLALPVLFVAAALVGALLGAPIERLVLRRMQDREPVLQLLATFALFMILEDLQKLVWGVQPVVFDAPMRLLGTIDVPFGADVIPYTVYQLFVLPGIAVLVLCGLSFVLRRTLAGRMLVAVTTDREAARAIGIDAVTVTSVTFTVGAALAALGGALASPTVSLVPGMGAQTIVLSFAVIATAGLGQVEGAALAALLIGLGRALAIYMAPEFEVVVSLCHHGPGASREAAGPVRRDGDAAAMSRTAEILTALAAAALVVLLAWAVPWLRFVLTVALAKGLAVLGLLVLLRAGQVSFGHALLPRRRGLCGGLRRAAAAGRPWCCFPSPFSSPRSSA